MLKSLSSKSAEPQKGVVEVSGGSRNRAKSVDKHKVDKDEFSDVEVNGEIDDEVDNEIGKNQKTSKSKKLSNTKKTIRSSDFLTPGVKLAFTKLRQAFLKASILHHFNLEYYIGIETDISGYAIGKVFSQLTLDDLGQWHPVVIFSCKIILAETRYEI